MPNKEPRNMKRLAVVLKPENVDSIISTLHSCGLEATIYEVRGATKGKQRVESGRGLENVDRTYPARRVVATVVNAGDVEEILERMKKSLTGVGAVVMISTVDDLVRL
jgi:nitrogen regulatory protein PII